LAAACPRPSRHADSRSTMRRRCREEAAEAEAAADVAEAKAAEAEAQAKERGRALDARIKDVRGRETAVAAKYVPLPPPHPGTTMNDRCMCARPGQAQHSQGHGLGFRETTAAAKCASLNSFFDTARFRGMRRASELGPAAESPSPHRAPISLLGARKSEQNSQSHSPTQQLHKQLLGKQGGALSARPTRYLYALFEDHCNSVYLTLDGISQGGFRS